MRVKIKLLYESLEKRNGWVISMQSEVKSKVAPEENAVPRRLLQVLGIADESNLRINPVYLAALKCTLSHDGISKDAAERTGRAASQKSYYDFMRGLGESKGENAPQTLRMLAFAPLSISGVRHDQWKRSKSNKGFVQLSFVAKDVVADGKQWTYRMRWHTVTSEDNGGYFPTWKIERADNLGNIEGPRSQLLAYVGKKEIRDAYLALSGVPFEEFKDEGSGVIWLPRALAEDKSKEGESPEKGPRDGKSDLHRRTLKAATHWPWIPEKKALEIVFNYQRKFQFPSHAESHAYFRKADNAFDMYALENTGKYLVDKSKALGDDVVGHLWENLIKNDYVVLLSQNIAHYFNAIEKELVTFHPRQAPTQNENPARLKSVLNAAATFAPEETWDLIDKHFGSLSSAARGAVTEVRNGLRDGDVGCKARDILEDCFGRILNLQTNPPSFETLPPRISRRVAVIGLSAAAALLLSREGYQIYAREEERKHQTDLAHKECHAIIKYVNEACSKDPKLKLMIDASMPWLNDLWQKLSEPEFILSRNPEAKIEDGIVEPELKSKTISNLKISIEDLEKGCRAFSEAAQRLKTSIENLAPDETLKSPNGFVFSKIEELIEDRQFISDVLGYPIDTVTPGLQTDCLNRIFETSTVSYQTLDRSASRATARFEGLKPTRDITYHADVILRIKAVSGAWSNTTELRGKGGGNAVYDQQFSSQEVPFPLEAESKGIRVFASGTFDVNDPNFNPNEPVLSMAEKELFYISPESIRSKLREIETSGTSASVTLGSTNGPVVFDFKMRAGHPDPDHPDVQGIVRFSITPVFVTHTRRLGERR